MATGLTDREEWALEKSAMEAFEKCGFDPQPEDDLGEWELALWTDYSTILVNKTTYLAAVITRDGRGGYTTDLVGNPMLGFLADQIHRCSAGALNGYRPVASTEVHANA